MPSLPHRTYPLRRALASAALLAGVAALGLWLSAWKQANLAAEEARAAARPEPRETVEGALARRRPYVATTTAIGTVRALRSITLENELAGTVREVHLPTGEVVEAGTVLVALDVSVEEAELEAQRAQAELAETLLGRVERALRSQGASEADVDRARAERDVALALVERTRAIIERKTVRAPFRARVGIADLHPGQYLAEGTELTTLQGVDESVHVDFSVVQGVAAELEVGDEVAVGAEPRTFSARVVALDARVDPDTRNAIVRARIDDAERAPAPGASVRVQVPLGESRPVVVVPVSALRRGPSGDHVFVLEVDGTGGLRARERRVDGGAVIGDEVVVEQGLEAGERVAASGSFKLFDGAAIALSGEPLADAAQPR